MADVPDSGVGFHAQQAAEKYLKAVFALNEVRVRRTHEMAALLAQLGELGVEAPEGLDAAVELTPYSVLERYPWHARPSRSNEKAFWTSWQGFAPGPRISPRRAD